MQSGVSNAPENGDREDYVRPSKLFRGVSLCAFMMFMLASTSALNKPISGEIGVARACRHHAPRAV